MEDTGYPIAEKLLIEIVIELLKADVRHCCVLGSVLLYKILQSKGIDCKLVGGYMYRFETACRHMWVELGNGIQLDVGNVLCRARDNVLACLPVLLLRELPKSAKLIGADDTEETAYLLELAITELENGCSIERYEKLWEKAYPSWFDVYSKICSQHGVQ